MGQSRSGLGATPTTAGLSGTTAMTDRQIEYWQTLLNAFGRGFEEPASRIWAELSDAEWPDFDPKIIEALPEKWAAYPEIEALLNSSSRLSLGDIGGRFAGMRIPWQGDDAAVAQFRDQLVVRDQDLPEPDGDVVEALRQLGHVTREGKIVQLDGMPVPAGKEQIRIFVTVRWRWSVSPLAKLHLIALRDPELIPPDDHKHLQIQVGSRPSLHHLVGYDAVHVTDEVQQRLFMYSIDTHRQNLISLQKNDLALFWAVWRRDVDAVDRLAKKATIKKLDEWLVAPDPRARKKLRNPMVRLRCGTSILSELERFFEIFEFMHANNAVTLEAVEGFVRCRTSLDEVLSADNAAGTYVLSAAGSLRYTHGSMNRLIDCRSKDEQFRRIATAVLHNKNHPALPQRHRRPFGGTPALHFLGIEQQYLIIVMLLTIVQDLKRLEGEYFRRVAHNQAGHLRPDVDAVHFAAVIAANVHPRYAEAMLGYISKQEPGEKWIAENIHPLIVNLRMQEEYIRLQSASSSYEEPIEFAGDGSSKNYNDLIKNARDRLKMLPRLPAHGWTRWFHFEAWQRQDAELKFLRKCVSSSRYSAKARKNHKRRVQKSKAKERAPATGGFTGLPTANPVDTVHDRFKPLFDQIQLPVMLAARFRKPYQRDLDILLNEIAKILPAATPITLDPALNDQILARVSDECAHTVIERDWVALRAPLSKRSRQKRSTKA